MATDKKYESTTNSEKNTTAKGQYQGSQAFNQYLPLVESVNTNTGTLTLTQPLIKLAGINNSIGLNINLVFSANLTGILNLPAGWVLDISYVIPGKTLTSKGRNYILDEQWSDDNGHYSGLRYVNNHGMKFESYDSPRNLLSGNPGNYVYCMNYADGSHEYFDINGKLVESDDRFGNTISYYYMDPAGGVLNNYLDKIVDSFGQIISFSYNAGAQLIIQLPNRSEVIVNYAEQGVQSIVDPLKNITSFFYGTFANENVITNISYANGLNTNISYVGIEYATTNGATGNFPAVSNLTHLDANNTLLEQTIYTYGQHTAGYTFTGYHAGYTLSDDHDGLMESNNNFYIYDIAIQKLDANGKILLEKVIYHNYLHLPVTVDDYQVNNGVSSAGHETRYTYDIDTNMHARSTNYDKPINIQTYAWSSKTSAYVPLNSSQNKYDFFGKLVLLEKAIYDVAKNDFVPQLETTHTFTLTTWGGEMPAVSTSKDLSSGYTKRTVYTLTQDQKNINSESIEYINAGNTSWTPWKTTTFTYDQCGRITSKTKQWSKGANPDPNSILSTTEKYSYQYDQSTHQLQVTTTNALGNDTIKIYDKSLIHSPVIKIKTSLGKVSTYNYDLLGRLIKHTDPKGYVKTFEYYLQTTSGYNSAVAINPTGYTKITYYDALNRSIKVMDNGDPTQTNTAAVSRILKQTVYNLLGKKYQTIDRLGLVSTYEYDSFGRHVKHIDVRGNVTEFSYDDSQSTACKTINGVLRLSIQQDGFGRELVSTVHPDPADKKIDYSIVKQTEYDAFNNKTKIVLYKSDSANKASLTVLQQLVLTYNPENKAITKQFTGYENLQTDVTEKIVYDLLNKILYSQRNTSYADGRNYQKQSEISEFNELGLLISRTNQKAQTEIYTYDNDAQLSSKKRYDNTVFTYTRDQNNNLQNIEWMENNAKFNITNSFNEVDVKTSVSDGKTAISYEHFLDNSLKTVIYPESKQQYNRDAYSRLTNLIDVSGASTLYTYYEVGFTKGLPHTVQQGNDSLLYTYSNLSDFPHTQGLLTSMSLSGNKTINRNYQYDGFNRVNLIKITDAEHALLTTEYEHDAINRLISLVKTSTLNSDKSVNFSRLFTYDGLNQLAASHTTYNNGQHDDITYTYDGSSNVLTCVTNSNTVNYQYNEINQLQSPEINYDTNGRVITDLSGYHYTYNQLDQMTSVASNNGNPILNYEYYPDGLLSKRIEGEAAQAFYYTNQIVNAVASNDMGLDKKTWTTFLLSQNERIAAYEDNQEPLYYFSSHGSTSLMISGDDSAGLDYESYGALKEDSMIPSNINASKYFTWNQEYTDPKTGLVYLRARFYNPKNMQFMSNDTKYVSNRYGFGGGDPINMIDPTGHHEQAVLAGLGGIIAFSAIQIVAVILASIFAPEIAPAAAPVIEEASAEAESAATAATAAESASPIMRAASQITMKTLAGVGLFVGGVSNVASAGMGMASAKSTVQNDKDAYDIASTVFLYIGLATSVVSGITAISKMITAAAGLALGAGRFAAEVGEAFVDASGDVARNTAHVVADDAQGFFAWAQRGFQRGFQSFMGLFEDSSAPSSAEGNIQPPDLSSDSESDPDYKINFKEIP